MSRPKEAMEAEIKREAKVYVEGPVSWIDDSYAAHKDTYEAGARMYAEKLQAEREQCKRDIEAQDGAFNALYAVKQELKRALKEKLAEERKYSERLRGALEGLTSAILANLKPLPSQVDAAFEALALKRPGEKTWP